MNLALEDNHMQPGFGAFLIFLYAMYGAYIASLYILTDDKAGLPSQLFFAFVLFFLLLGLSNFGKLLLTKTLTIGPNSIILIFFPYIILKFIIDDPPENILSLGTISSEIVTNFIVGFIAFSTIVSRAPINSTLVFKSNSPPHARMASAIVSGTVWIPPRG